MSRIVTGPWRVVYRQEVRMSWSTSDNTTAGRIEWFGHDDQIQQQIDFEGEISAEYIMTVLKYL